MSDSAENDPTMPPPPQKGGFPSWLIFIAVVLAVSFSAKLVIDSFSRAPARVIESTTEAARNAAILAADAIKQVFQVEPQVQVYSKVIQLQSAPILELALIERDFYLTNVWKGSWLRSEKELTVSGSFTAKAGFDLQKRFEVEVNETDRQVYLYLPTPELLSLDIGDDIELEGKSGLWNRITDDDRNRVMQDFRRDAQAQAVASDLLQQAQKEAEERLREVLPDEDWKVVILFTREEGLTGGDH